MVGERLMIKPTYYLLYNILHFYFNGLCIIMILMFYNNIIYL